MNRLIFHEEDNLYYVPSEIKFSLLGVNFLRHGDAALIEDSTER